MNKQLESKIINCIKLMESINLDNLNFWYDQNEVEIDEMKDFYQVLVTGTNKSDTFRWNKFRWNKNKETITLELVNHWQCN